MFRVGECGSDKRVVAMGVRCVVTASILLLDIPGVHGKCQGHQKPMLLTAHPYIASHVDHTSLTYHTYPNNSFCEWLITADTGYVVRLTFLLVDLQDGDSSDCPFDRLTLYDGDTRESRMLGVFCSQRLANGKSVDSSLRWLYVEFKDGARGRGRGNFLFTYEAVHPELPSTTAVSDTFSCQPRETDIHASPGVKYVLRSLNYRRVGRCEWRIQTDFGYVISLQAEAIDLKTAPTSVCDNLQVFDGLTEFAQQIPMDCSQWRDPVYSSSQFMYVTLTYVSGTATGDFKLWVEATVLSVTTAKRSCEKLSPLGIRAGIHVDCGLSCSPADHDVSDDVKEAKSRMRVLGIICGSSVLGFAVLIAIAVVVVARAIKKARSTAADGQAATSIAMTTISTSPPASSSSSYLQQQRSTGFLLQQNATVFLFPPATISTLPLGGCQGSGPATSPTQLGDLPPPYASIAVKTPSPVPSRLPPFSLGEPPPAYSSDMLISHPPTSPPPPPPPPPPSPKSPPLT